MADNEVTEPRLRAIQAMFTEARHASSQSAEATEMGANRRLAMRREGSSAGGGNISFVSGRPQDPLWYWKQSNLPFNIWEDPHGLEIQRVRELCRLLYVTHPLLGSAIDIYSRYPLSGMDIICPKDPSIAEFYREMYFDDLDYEEYLTDIGREHWLVGEAFPLGGFNELTGTFDSDDLMLPEDVNVIRTPFANEPRFEMALPSSIRQILNDRRPEMEYRQLVENYPEFLALNVSDWVTMPNQDKYMIPVSGALLSHVMRKGDSFHNRGIPILMRAFRAVAQEEMLNSAQDSISQRLYTPLILARIGASATDLGTTTPWIPQQGDLDSFVEDVNAALAADFRLITTHFAVQMQNVFGRESMPNLGPDFDRLEAKMLQAFGLSKTLVSGADGGQTYAADALNRDLVTQLLHEYQRKVKRFFRKRSEVVAEAQGHYDFTRKGGRPVPVMETVQEVDEETGDIRFVERPKLLLPELRIKAMNMRDEEQHNTFVEQLRASGVPISQRSRLVNVDIDLDEEAQAAMDEQIKHAVYNQEVRKRTYLALQAQGLPIPEDLKTDFEPHTQAPQTAATDGSIATLGDEDPASTAALAPVAEDADDAEAEESLVRENRVLSRPPESDEQRAGMPRAAMSKTAWKDGPDAWMEEFGADVARIAMMVNLPVDPDAEPSDDPALGPPATHEVSMPVIGSFRTRHLGVQRDVAYFYRKAEVEAAERAERTAEAAKAVESARHHDDCHDEG